ncbi:MAG TPA: DUF3696 domain-containing protein [Thermoanaerobaculia bacterium]|nr:DUF3696 domain-containing protein [Thermoanaerobaculia bacterium]
MGAYEQIATFGHASFVLGCELGLGLATTTFGQSKVIPAPISQSLEMGAYRINVSFKDGRAIDINLNRPDGQSGLERSGRTDISLRDYVSFLAATTEKREVFDNLWPSFLASLGPRPYAFAPVRTKPQRTYDPIQDIDSPEGSHVPMFLAGASFRDLKAYGDFLSGVDSFGKASGLFDRVEVRRLGDLESDPFQVQVHIGGNAVNLIDVGYGVSQALPIVVDCLRGKEGGTFLLQQPEVHLHPRAQAELGSFLGALAKQQNKRFVIETHSDYLVDRIRMDIRDGKGLTPEDVSLLYFERKNGQVNIHRLTLDEYGNLLDPPPGYRDFFFDEARRFLGG